MMETIELEGSGDQARQVLEELMEIALLEPGRILMVGCSSSEIDSFKIGFHSSAEIGMAVHAALYQEPEPKGIYLAAQCCEHLNRALILEAEAAQVYSYEPVNMAPQLEAKDFFATVTYATLEYPVAVKHTRAHAGIGIGDALIGMHVKDVAVLVRIKIKEIGSAHMVCARTRPKFISDIRARYDEENMQEPQPVTGVKYGSGI